MQKPHVQKQYFRQILVAGNYIYTPLVRDRDKDVSEFISYKKIQDHMYTVTNYRQIFLK